MTEGITRVEPITLAPAVQYRGTFAPSAAAPVEGALLPPGWEGLYFPYDAPLAALRDDGSPAEDGILPAIDLPRRLYAGEDTVFHRPLRFGEVVEQRVSLGGVTRKRGRAGELVFADVERRYSVGGEAAVTSVWHDVFLGGEPGPARAPVPVEGEWEHRDQLTLDSRQLFRFSAITFNTHRVHYDRRWAREVEGLDDLLVHGPLTRILLLDAVGRWMPDRAIASFGIRSLAPVLVGREVQLLARSTDAGAEVVAADADGGALARGELEWG